MANEFTRWLLKSMKKLNGKAWIQFWKKNEGMAGLDIQLKNNYEII